MAPMTRDDDNLEDFLFNLPFLEACGTTDEANNGYDPLELTQVSDHPKVIDWKNAPDDDMIQMRVSVDKARRFLWRRSSLV